MIRMVVTPASFPTTALPSACRPTRPCGRGRKGPARTWPAKAGNGRGRRVTAAGDVPCRGAGPSSYSAGMLTPRTLDRLHSLATFLNTAPGPHGGQVLEERLVYGTQIPDVVPAVHEGRNRVRVANAALQRAHGLRGRVAAVWADADAGKDVTEQVNALLEEVGALALMETEDGLVYGPASQTSDAVERLTALAALALADVVAEGEAARLRVCAGEDCGNVLVDASRNRSKRFCDEANCGNRLHVRSYRARQAEGRAETETEAEAKAEHAGEDGHKDSKKSKKKKKKDKDKKKRKKKGKKKSKD